MTMHNTHRGGSPVGYVAELDAVEASAVIYLRLWCDSPQSQAKVRQDFTATLGSAYGREALQRFEELCQLCTQYARRPLMRHQVACKCLGADESCFAHFIGYASDGAHEDALMMANTLVRPDMAAALVHLAEQFACALKSISIQLSSQPRPPASHTLH